MRLDIYLTEQKKISRTRASNLIELGRVSVNGAIIRKASFTVKENDVIEIIENYEASLGGIKLKGALGAFKTKIKGKVCLDIGASNGGFTEVLLDQGAAKIYALDVGECALPTYLRENPSIIIKDRYNARFLDREHFEAEISLVTIDVSFISLELILPAVYSLLKEGEVIALIKPQFECGKKELTKTGLVKDFKTVQKILEKIKLFSKMIGFSVGEVIEAPKPFSYKNQEYFIHLTR